MQNVKMNKVNHLITINMPQQISSFVLSALHNRRDFNHTLSIFHNKY